jgi:hypothetical protein
VCVGFGRNVKARVLFNVECAVLLEEYACVCRTANQKFTSLMWNKCECVYVRMCLCMCVRACVRACVLCGTCVNDCIPHECVCVWYLLCCAPFRASRRSVFVQDSNSSAFLYSAREPVW